MEKSRIVSRVDLGEDTLIILREFDEWFLPATHEEVGVEFLIFLKWLKDNDYSIIKKQLTLL